MGKDVADAVLVSLCLEMVVMAYSLGVSLRLSPKCDSGWRDHLPEVRGDGIALSYRMPREIAELTAVRA